MHAFLMLELGTGSNQAKQICLDGQTCVGPLRNQRLGVTLLSLRIKKSKAFHEQGPYIHTVGPHVLGWTRLCDGGSDGWVHRRCRRQPASLYLYTKSISHLNSILVFYFLFYYYYCSYLIKILIFNFKFKNNCNIDATKLLLHLLPTKHYVNLSLFSPPFFSIQTQCKSLPFLLLPLSSIKIDPLPSLFFNQTELNCVFSTQF